MGGLKALTYALAGAIVTASSASAADMLPPPLLPAPHQPMTNHQPAEFSGWYLRGDIGVGHPGKTDHESTFAPGVTIPGFRAVTSNLDSSAFVGVGAGYKFNNWFRADVTGEYRSKAQYTALNHYTGTAPGCIECYDQYQASFHSGVFLANGYVDLGSWSGLTPFIGAGVGMAYNVVKDITDHNPTTAGGFGYGKGDSKFGFAWAVMAGLSYQVTQNVSLELGYRYLDAGKAETGVINCANGGGCSNERQSFRVTSHDMRLGMRWHFADEAAPVMQPPLIRKY